jgi:hypothetical protein
MQTPSARFNGAKGVFVSGIFRELAEYDFLMGQTVLVYIRLTYWRYTKRDL